MYKILEEICKLYFIKKLIIFKTFAGLNGNCCGGSTHVDIRLELASERQKFKNITILIIFETRENIFCKNLPCKNTFKYIKMLLKLIFKLY